MYTLSFDLQGMEIMEDEDIENIEHAFDTLEIAGGKATQLSLARLEAAEECSFKGWTYNDVTMYEPGDVFLMPDHDVELKPVILDSSIDVEYTLSYDSGDYELVGILPKVKKLPANIPFSVTGTYCLADGLSQFGWTDGENDFLPTDKVIMPAHDVVLTPKWYKLCNIYYQAGDVDNVNGKSEVAMEKREGISYELANASRLSRSGYDLTGWYSDYDQKEHALNETVIQPAADIHYTAVWKPSVYKLTLYSNNTLKQKTLVNATYGTNFVVPECSYKYYGYKFTGWKYKTAFYQPGDEFEVPALISGQSLTLSAQWEADDSFEKSSELDVFSMVEARKSFNEEKTDELELSTTHNYVINK